MLAQCRVGPLSCALEGLSAATENLRQVTMCGRRGPVECISEALLVYPTFTTSRPVANRSGGACVHLRGRSSAVKLGRHVITYRKAVGPLLHIRISRRKAGGDYTVWWWCVLRRLCPCGISPIVICLRCLFRRHLSPEAGVRTDRHTERLTQHQQR